MSTSQTFKELEFLGFDPLSIREALRTHKDFDSALEYLNSHKNLQIEANLSLRGIPKGAAKKLASMFNSADEAEKFYINYLPEAEKIRNSGIEMGFPLNIIERTIDQLMPFNEAIENISSQTIQRNWHSVAPRFTEAYKEATPQILYSENVDYQNQSFNAKRRGNGTSAPSFDPPAVQEGIYGGMPDISHGYQPVSHSFSNPSPARLPSFPGVPPSDPQLAQNYYNFINNQSPLLRSAPQSVDPHYQNSSYANPNFPSHSYTQQPVYRSDQSPAVSNLSQSAFLPPPPLYPNHNPLANWPGGVNINPANSNNPPQPPYPPMMLQTRSNLAPVQAANFAPRFSPASIPQGNPIFPPAVNPLPANYPQSNQNRLPPPLSSFSSVIPQRNGPPPVNPPVQYRIEPAVNNPNLRPPPNPYPHSMAGQQSRPDAALAQQNAIPPPPILVNPLPNNAAFPRALNQLNNLPTPLIQRMDSGVSISVNRGNQPPQNFVLERNLGNNFEEAYDTISLTLNNRTLNNRGIRLQGADQDYMVLEFTDLLEGLYGRLALIQILANMYEPQGMDEEAIDALQKFNYSKAMKLTSETCVICYDDFEEGIQAVMLPCNHPFHTDCIGTWLKNSTKCPLCKSDMAENA